MSIMCICLLAVQDAGLSSPCEYIVGLLFVDDVLYSHSPVMLSVYVSHLFSFESACTCFLHMYC